ncbi:MAG: peroxiredoxin [Xanthomonadaceae bacterium]|nr:peroxiredoxin [Xanthomonadaceae bacterium]
MNTTITIVAVVAVIAIAAALLYPRTVGAQPQEGEPAPAFSLLDQNNERHTLEDYAGKWLVLYFYPKADTPGCTTEACNFRDDIFRFRAMGASIVGVSLDDVESQQAFAEKYSLPFPLLSDAGKEMSTAYGVLTARGPIEYAKRETFIIAPDGTIAKHYGSVNADTHSAQVLGDLTGLMGE